MDGKCALFLHVLSIVKLDVGCYPCQIIVQNLDGLPKAGAMPLPFLLTKIWAPVKKLQPRVYDHIKLQLNHYFTLLQSDILGCWRGVEVKYLMFHPY